MAFILAGLAGRALAVEALAPADAGIVRAVAVGEAVDLRLPENPSTGYAWNFEISPPNAAAPVSDHWAAQSGLIGAPGTRDLAFAIKRAGPLSIRVKLWRPWEGEASVTQRLEFRFDAR